MILLAFIIMVRVALAFVILFVGISFMVLIYMVELLCRTILRALLFILGVIP